MLLVKFFLFPVLHLMLVYNLLLKILLFYYRLLPTAPCLARILDEPAELEGYQLPAGVSF